MERRVVTEGVQGSNFTEEDYYTRTDDYSAKRIDTQPYMDQNQLIQTSDYVYNGAGATCPEFENEEDSEE